MEINAKLEPNAMGAHLGAIGTYLGAMGATLWYHLPSLGCHQVQ